jgi:hypothetical protein
MPESADCDRELYVNGTYTPERRLGMLLSRLMFAAGLVVASATAALACPGQTGKVIFSDDFKDDSGGWSGSKNVAYAQGGMQVTADPDHQGIGVTNVTFNAIDGDYCAVFAFPATPSAADNPDSIGLRVLDSSTYNNGYNLNIHTDGEGSITAFTSADNLTIMPSTKMDNIKTAPGSENELRIVVKDQKLTFYINGKQIKAVRTQANDKNNNLFGFWLGTDNKKPADARVFIVKSFNLTEAQ